jgi:hypothetical protein
MTILDQCLDSPTNFALALTAIFIAIVMTLSILLIVFRFIILMIKKPINYATRKKREL